MNKTQRCIISSTNIDSQGYKMMKSALESALPQLNGQRKIRIGLEHIRTFPPFGVVMNGEILEGDDKEFYLVAENVYFDKREHLMLPDGTELLKESFSNQSHPFVECEDSEVEKIEISTDPSNYDSYEVIKEINKSVSEESGLEFNQHFFGRKSNLPDPETIITITKILAAALGVIKSKIPEKIGEVVGEDLAKFYKLLSKLAVETIKKAKPANRPKNFVIVYPNNECIVELVVTTNNPDRVLFSLTKEKLEVIDNKINQLGNLIPEKIQFVFADNDSWEFNYLLSKDGSVIGTIKAFDKRNTLYEKILQGQQGKEEDKQEI